MHCWGSANHSDGGDNSCCYGGAACSFSHVAFIIVQFFVSRLNKRRNVLQLLKLASFTVNVRKQTLQNVVESMEAVTSRSNSPDSFGTTKLRSDITMRLDTLLFVEDGITPTGDYLGRNGCSTFILQRPRNFWLALFWCVVRVLSCLTVSGSVSLLGFFSKIGKKLSFLHQVV